jgi:RNA polymerase sigma-70 factor (sigma-E family)
VRRDDEREFDMFVAARTPVLLRTAFLLTGDREAAQDLLQESLVRLYRHWGRIVDPQARLAYARKVMASTAANGRRRGWRRETPNGHSPPDVAVTVDPYEDFDNRAALLGALRALSPAHRAVLVLRFYEDLSESQTAQALGCSAGTVKSRTSRALAVLRENGLHLSGDYDTRSAL